GRDVAQLERHLQPFLGVAFAEVDEEPQAEGDGQRQQLEPEVAGHQRAQALRIEQGLPDAAPQLQQLRSVEPLHAFSSLCNVLRNVPASTSRVIRPSRTIEIAPSSSEITTTMASVSSVSPIAARWRVPRVLLTCGLVVSGRKQPAAMIRPWCRIKAPS